MSAIDKPIIVSKHAAQRMTQRGATLKEAEQTIRNGVWQSSQRGKLHTRLTFPYDAISPVNGRRYACKTVDVVFADDPRSIVIVTVKVYYHD